MKSTIIPFTSCLMLIIGISTSGFSQFQDLHIQSNNSILTVEAVTGNPKVQLTNDASNTTNGWVSVFDRNDGNQLKFRYNNTTRMTLSTIGRLGLGIVDPQTIFHIHGDGFSSDDLFIESSSDNGGLSGWIGLSRSEGTPGSKTASSSINNSLGRIAWRSYDGAQYNNIYYMEGFGSTNSGSLKFFTRNASGTFQVLHLDFEGNIRVPSGNLGINSVDPDVELVVKQRQTPVASLGGLTIKPAGLKIADDDDDFWLQYVDTFNYLNFAYNGQLLAQMSSASGDLFTFSDIRLKKRIEYMSSILDKVLKLRPISYHYKHDQTDNLDIGFIAQEVELIFPELVSEVDGLKSLPYSKFAVLAIKAIQEQQEQIDQLQKMVLALQEKVDRMNDTEVGSK